LRRSSRAAGRSASAPVTIEPLPGLASAPVLDGDGPDAPARETCSTLSCDGPVLAGPDQVAGQAVTAEAYLPGGHQLSLEHGCAVRSPA